MYLENIFIGSEDIRKQLPQVGQVTRQPVKFLTACSTECQLFGSRKVGLSDTYRAQVELWHNHSASSPCLLWPQESIMFENVHNTFCKRMRDIARIGNCLKVCLSVFLLQK
jgi:hypothetical protein